MHTEHFIPGKDAALESAMSRVQGKRAAHAFAIEQCPALPPIDRLWPAHSRNQASPLMLGCGLGEGRA